MPEQTSSRSASILPLLLLAACAALFVLQTSLALPAVVASHFGPSWQANGFMPRSAYTGCMLVVVVLVPVVSAWLPLRAFRGPEARINLPNRDYWLAPERRATTIAYLSRQAVRFSLMLMTFLCYAHWLVVKANQHTPPLLSPRAFVGGLAIFLLATLVWLVTFIGRLRRLPRTDPQPRRSRPA